MGCLDEGLRDELSGEADVGNSQEHPIIKPVCADLWKVRLEKEFGVCLQGAGNMKLKGLNFNFVGNREP